jgi:hypothetical protein
MRRTTRDWIADIGLFLFAAGFSVVTADSVMQGLGLSRGPLVADQIVGALACAAVFLRRRWLPHSRRPRPPAWRTGVRGEPARPWRYSR